jgi:predicted Zn-ribbon and HTH transcriptional regulator
MPIYKKLFSLSTATLLVSLVLSSIAAWYSILGLTAIFSGAVIPIIVMGGALEVAKVVTTVWLHRYWKRTTFVLRLYLVPAVIVLAFLTSLGIFGFLSKSHSDQNLVSGDVVAKIAIYDEKIKNERDNIEVARKALKQLDDAVDQVMGRSSDEKGATKAVTIRNNQQKDRLRFQNEISESQTKISKLNDERAPIAAEIRKTEADVGPIKYIAALIYGDNPDSNLLERAVRWVIIIIVFVFDPLALTLVIAATSSYKWLEEDFNSMPVTKPKEVLIEDDTDIFDDEILDKIDQSISEKQEEIIKEFSEQGLTLEEPHVDDILLEINDPVFKQFSECPKCKTQLLNAPGIGLFCPNKECDVLDDWASYEEIPKKKVYEEIEIVEPDYCPKCNQEMIYFPMVGQPFCLNMDCEENNYDRSRIDEESDARPHEVMGEVLLEHDSSTPNEIPAGSDELLEPVEEIPSSEEQNIITEGITLNEVHEGYVQYEGKVITTHALQEMRPDLFRVKPDSVSKQISTNFGTEFPKLTAAGNIFVRVDMMPNRVYKFDGAKWIEINKNNSDSYLYNEEYIQHLINQIDVGEYDIELLSDNERLQIETYLSNK